ncbi:MAG TPA: hypothetical protein VFC73_02180 [Syntrophomonadaceae bacterium]|nr:hypothetical protein [Syntrophomonadaceae bacterium]
MSNYLYREERSYDGNLMEKGKVGERIVMDWLEKRLSCNEIIDMREFRISQRLDVDCGIETINGDIVLAEIKTDYNLGRTKNVLFEIFRINHFARSDNIFYLGWAFRSPAKYLLYYSPREHAIYEFLFEDVRKIIGSYVAQHRPNIQVTATDQKKTTFNMLIPFSFIKGAYKKHNLDPEP